MSMLTPRIRPIDVLLVEDNPGDVRLTQEALRRSGAAVHVHVVNDGEKALEFLRRSGAYREAPRPRVVLLDLGLPGKHGREVLAEAKADPALSRIPVIVVSAERSPDEVTASYDHHANAYVTKPDNIGRFESMVRAFEDFWLRCAILPEE